jgi:hypothetical protein
MIKTFLSEHALKHATVNEHPNGNKTHYAEPEVGSSHKGIKDVCVENFRPMRVIVIGASFSAIYCGIRIFEKLRNVDLTIYEKNAGVGGIWFETRYPGCAMFPGSCNSTEVSIW